MLKTLSSNPNPQATRHADATRKSVSQQHEPLSLSEWPLRIGCGFVNLYAGFFLITDPARFHRYVPSGFSNVLNSVASVDTYLQLQGVGEVSIAFCMVAWFLPRWCVRLAAMLLAVEMALILAFVGVDAVTFRNVGLLGASLSLFHLICSSQTNVRALRQGV